MSKKMRKKGRFFWGREENGRILKPSLFVCFPLFIKHEVIVQSHLTQFNKKLLQVICNVRNYSVGGRKSHSNEFCPCARKNFEHRLIPIRGSQMTNTLPNGKCIYFPYSVIYCNVTSVHISCGEFPDGTCVGNDWDAIRIQQFHEDFICRFNLTMQNRVSCSIKRAYHRRNWEGQVILFTKLNTEVFVFGHQFQRVITQIKRRRIATIFANNHYFGLLSIEVKTKLFTVVNTNVQKTLQAMTRGGQENDVVCKKYASYANLNNVTTVAAVFQKLDQVMHVKGENYWERLPLLYKIIVQS